MFIMNPTAAPEKVTIIGSGQITYTNGDVDLKKNNIVLSQIGYNFQNSTDHKGNFNQDEMMAGYFPIVTAEETTRQQIVQAVGQSVIFSMLEFFLLNTASAQLYCYQYIRLLQAYFINEDTTITSEQASNTPSHHYLAYGGISIQHFMDVDGTITPGSIFSANLRTNEVGSALLTAAQVPQKTR